jgi:hypothetical protein
VYVYVYDYDIPLLELDISMPVLIKQLAQPTLLLSLLLFGPAGAQVRVPQTHRGERTPRDRSTFFIFISFLYIITKQHKKRYLYNDGYIVGGLFHLFFPSSLIEPARQHDVSIKNHFTVEAHFIYLFIYFLIGAKGALMSLRAIPAYQSPTFCQIFI